MRLRLLLAALVAAAAAVSLGYLTRVPVGSAPTHAVLRLAWRLPGIRLETCRPLTEEERERIPPHMRREEVCEGRSVPYRLRVDIGDQTRRDLLLEHAGARSDRPIYVLESLELEPGPHRVAVSFAPTEVPDTVALDSVTLRYDGVITLDSGQIGLLTLSSDDRRLELRGYGAQ